MRKPQTEPLSESEEQDVHTLAQPYCTDLVCWCHTDVDYHDTVTQPLPSYSEEEIENAYTFFAISYS